MAVISHATLAQVFKILQPNGFESSVLDVSPMLGLMPKFTGFYGESKQLDWLVDRGGGVSASFAVAQAQAGVPAHRKPTLTRARLYAVRQINNEDLEASENNEGALVRLLSHAQETATDELRSRAGSVLWGDGSGAVARLTATANTATDTTAIRDLTQVVNLRVGGRYQFFDAVGNALRSAGAVATIESINEDTGAITWTTNLTASVAAAAASDYIVPEGDYQAVPQGIFGWNPMTVATTGDNWFGVDRYPYGNAMVGGRVTYTTGSIDENLKKAIVTNVRQGGKADSLFLNPEDWGRLERQSTNWQRITKNAIGSNGKEIASIGFSGLVLQGPNGPVNVYSDPFCPQYEFELTKMSSWELQSLKEAFRLILEGMNGQGSHPLATADGIELRFGGYWQTALKKPRDSFHGRLPGYS